MVVGPPSCDTEDRLFQEGTVHSNLTEKKKNKGHGLCYLFSLLGGKLTRISPRSNDPKRKLGASSSTVRKEVKVQVDHYTEKFAKEKQERKWVISPTCSFMKRWDIVVTAVLLYTAIVTPFEVAFLQTRLNYLFLLNRFVDLLFAADMVIQFFLSYYDERQGRYVYDLKIIRAYYLKGWFTVDAVSLLPFDIIDLFVETSSMSSLKVLRALKLMKLAKLLRMLPRAVNQLHQFLGLSNSNFTLLKFLVMVIAVIHWIACVWKLVPSLERFLYPSIHAEEDGDPGSSWDAAARLWVERDNLKSDGLVDLYLLSVEYSIMSMVMGYGTMRPVSSFERMSAVLMMMLGGCVYAYVIGSICGVVNMRDPAKQEYLQAVDLLNQYVSEINLPEHTRGRLRDYFRHCEHLFRNTYYQHILSDVTPALRREIALHTHQAWLNGVSFLQSPEESERIAFFSSICTKLVSVSFAPLEHVYRERDRATQMFIIHRGMVGQAGKVIRTGGYFGEEMILHNARRPNTATSITYLDTFTLSHEDLYLVLEEAGDKLFTTHKLIRRAVVGLALRSKMLEILRAHRLVFGSRTPARTAEMSAYKARLQELAASRAARQGADANQGREDRKRQKLILRKEIREKIKDRIFLNQFVLNKAVETFGVPEPQTNIAFKGIVRKLQEQLRDGTYVDKAAARGSAADFSPDRVGEARRGAVVMVKPVTDREQVGERRRSSGGRVGADGPIAHQHDHQHEEKQNEVKIRKVARGGVKKRGGRSVTRGPAGNRPHATESNAKGRRFSSAALYTGSHPPSNPYVVEGNDAHDRTPGGYLRCHPHAAELTNSAPSSSSQLMMKSLSSLVGNRFDLQELVVAMRVRNIEETRAAQEQQEAMGRIKILAKAIARHCNREDDVESILAGCP